MKISITVVKNREPYYFITICKCKQGPLSLFSYHLLASILTVDERSSYYKVYNLDIEKSSDGKNCYRNEFRRKCYKDLSTNDVQSVLSNCLNSSRKLRRNFPIFQKFF